MAIVEPVKPPRNDDPKERERFYRDVALRLSYISYAGNPTNNVIPRYIGDDCFDTTNEAWYKSVGILNTSWRMATTNYGGVVTPLYNAATSERGWLIKMINKTGSATVKGTLVSISTAVDKGFILQANEYDTVGVVYEAGVADASEAWIWMPGSICQVLYKNTIAATAGNILIASDTDGRAIDIANPGGGLPGTDTHFKECGHVMETKAGGTNVLVLACIHFN